MAKRLDADSVIAADMEGLPDADLLDEIKALILAAEAERPRSQQTALGPSQVGHECRRQLAFMIHLSLISSSYTGGSGGIDNNIRGVNRSKDPMAAIIGTATHAWMEDALAAANKRAGKIVWIPEMKVEIRPGLSGTSDAYHLPTSSVLDWKFPGSTVYQKIVSKGWPPEYRGQAHTYGRGYINKGFPVKSVGNVYISRAGSLSKIHIIREPYNDGLVTDILTRYDEVEATVKTLDVGRNPQGFLQLPITPSDACRYCPWFSYAPQGPWQCAGKDEQRRPD